MLEYTHIVEQIGLSIGIYTHCRTNRPQMLNSELSKWCLNVFKNENH